MMVKALSPTNGILDVSEMWGVQEIGIFILKMKKIISSSSSIGLRSNWIFNILDKIKYNSILGFKPNININNLKNNKEVRKDERKRSKIN